MLKPFAPAPLADSKIGPGTKNIFIDMAGADQTKLCVAVRQDLCVFGPG